MPGIIFLRRRWAIASDDFVYPSFVELCFRSSWLLAISILFGIHHGSFNCDNGYLLRYYYTGSIILLSFGIVLTAAMMWLSMKGSIRNDYARRHLNIILYLKLLLLLPEAIWITVATYWTFGFSYSCELTVYWTARGAVICAWIVGFWMFIGILIVFDPMGSVEQHMDLSETSSRKSSKYLIANSKSVNARVWEQRCRCLCCCISSNQEIDNAFADVSKLVADFFKDTDLVATDIAAGLVLVGQEQRHQKEKLTAVAVHSANAGRSPTTIENNRVDVMRASYSNRGQQKSWMTLPMMTHYMKFALGSYGWPFFMYNHFTTGVCRLCIACRCCACVRAPKDVVSDNICHCHTAAIKNLTKIKDQDLIYVSFHDKYLEIPFYVAVDRRFSSVVVSIRGTLSLQDALTDLSAKGVPLEIDGVSDAFCHSAMLRCAEYVKAELENRQLLEKAFSSLEEGSRLFIVGHSLGAGVAAILTILLKSSYPNIACFAYSPPGGLMSLSASHYTQDFVCSVVVGDDIIPRLSMPNMCYLKIQLLRALCTSNTPKYKILASGCFRILCGCTPHFVSSSSLEEESPLTPQLQAQYSTMIPVQLGTERHIKKALLLAEDYAKEMAAAEWQLFPPGQILHITEDEEGRLCSGEPQYTAVWSTPEAFSSVVISSRMIMDHFPDVVLQALSQLESCNFVPSAEPMVHEPSDFVC